MKKKILLTSMLTLALVILPAFMVKIDDKPTEKTVYEQKNNVNSQAEGVKEIQLSNIYDIINEENKEFK